MGQFRLEIAEASLCEGCSHEVALSELSCPRCGANTYRLSFDTFYSELENFHIMDARYGGYVLGRNDAEDDIPMYTFAGNGLYSFRGLMQGGEYILSKAATLKYRDRLEEINSDKGSANLPFHPENSEYSSVINTNFMPKFGGIWISHSQFIINRFATQKYFKELEKLNWEANQEFASQNPIEGT
jgi:hypothetical protein